MADLKIKELRERGNETQIEVSNAIKTHPMTYNNYEKKKSEPNIDTLIKLADYHNVTLDYLCGRKFLDEIGYQTPQQREATKILMQLNNENLFKVTHEMLGIIMSQ